MINSDHLNKELVNSLPHFTPCKVIQIPESGKSLLWDLESGKFLLVESGILDLESGIQIKVIRNPANDWNRNPKSTDEECGFIHSVDSRIQDCFGPAYIITCGGSLYVNKKATTIM